MLTAECAKLLLQFSRSCHHQGKFSVVLAPQSVEILDDGVGCNSENSRQNGQGLAGLRRRAEALGGKLTVGGREDQPGFRVRVEVPS